MLVAYVLVFALGAAGGAPSHHHHHHHHSGHPPYNRPHHLYHQRHFHQHHQRPRRQDFDVCRDEAELLENNTMLVKCCEQTHQTLAFQQVKPGWWRPLRVTRKSMYSLGGSEKHNQLCPTVATELDIDGFRSANGTALTLSHTEQACAAPRSSDTCHFSGIPGQQKRTLRYLRSCREAASTPCSVPTYTCRTEFGWVFVVPQQVLVCGDMACGGTRCQNGPEPRPA